MDKSNVAKLPTRKTRGSAGKKQALTMRVNKLLADVQPVVAGEVMAVARQVAGGDHHLEAGDLTQIRDLAECCQRIHAGNEKAAAAKDDPGLWCKLISKVQSDTALKRSLLRDLKATKLARTAGAKDSGKPDGGADWAGVL